MPIHKWSRRELIGVGTMASGGLLLPRWAHPAVGAKQRRFLFLLCDGGWDQTMVFCPTFDMPDIADEDGAQRGSVGDIEFVDHEDRPSVRSFFEQYGHKSCIFNGFEVRSIAHQRCQQIVLTGGADGIRDDWGAILAGNAIEDLMLPCLVASGPSFTNAFTQHVVRVGETGQLSRLLDGTAVNLSLPPSPDAEAIIDAHVRARAQAFSELSTRREQEFGSRYLDALLNQLDLNAYQGELDLTVDPSKDLIPKLTPVLDCLEQGLSRVAMVVNLGVNDQGFDTHSDNYRQSAHFEQLFGDLITLMEQLEQRSGPAGGTLAEEVTVVVLSELGRNPVLNQEAGKEHWTWTSAMLIGDDISSGVVGGYDEMGRGISIHPETGQFDSAGVKLTAEHLGATVLTLGGVDSEQYLPSISPIVAVTQ